MISPGANLGESLGSKDFDHIRRWMEAMWRGRDAAPRCQAVTKLGYPCRGFRMRGASRCHAHLHGKARTEIDRQRLPRLYRLAHSFAEGEIGRERAAAAIERIRRRELHLAWKRDPTLPGSTIALTEKDEARVRRYLWDQFGLDLDKPQRGLSPRCVDRCRWAAALALQKKISREKAQRRVLLALRDDERYLSALDELDVS